MQSVLIILGGIVCLGASLFASSGKSYRMQAMKARVNAGNYGWRRWRGRKLNPYEEYARVWTWLGPETMLYRDYLDSHWWQKKQKRAVHRAKFYCQLCGAKPRALYVRHRNHKRLGHERLSDLIVLCPECEKTFKRTDE